MGLASSAIISDHLEIIMIANGSRSVRVSIQSGQMKNAAKLLAELGMNPQYVNNHPRCLRFKGDNVDLCPEVGHAIDLCPRPSKLLNVSYNFNKPQDAGSWLVHGEVDVLVSANDFLLHLNLDGKHVERLPLNIDTDDLNVGSRLCICGKPGIDLSDARNRVVVMHKNVQTILDKHGIDGESIHSSGSCESMLCSGVADLALMEVHKDSSALQDHGLIKYKELPEFQLGVWVVASEPIGRAMMKKAMRLCDERMAMRQRAAE